MVVQIRRFIAPPGSIRRHMNRSRKLRQATSPAAGAQPLTSDQVRDEIRATIPVWDQEADGVRALGEIYGRARRG